MLMECTISIGLFWGNSVVPARSILSPVPATHKADAGAGSVLFAEGIFDGKPGE